MKATIKLSGRLRALNIDGQVSGYFDRQASIDSLIRELAEIGITGEMTACEGQALESPEESGNQVVLGQINMAELCRACGEFRGDHSGTAYDQCRHPSAAWPNGSVFIAQ